MGSTWRQGPINDEQLFADCFSQLHGGNPAFNNVWITKKGRASCDQSWMNKIADIEKFRPPNGAGWWPPR